MGSVGTMGALSAEPTPSPANPLVFSNHPNEYITRIVADLMEKTSGLAGLRHSPLPSTPKD